MVKKSRGVTLLKTKKIWIDHKMIIIQQCDAIAPKANAVLGCMNTGTESRSREVIVSILR